MTDSRDPRFEFCPRIGSCVRVCQSEAQCRARHGCLEAGCPLMHAFGLASFDRRMRAFSTANDLWPLRPQDPGEARPS